MSVAVDNTGQSAGGTSLTSLSIASFAVGAGSNRLLFVGVSQFKTADTAPTGNFNTSETLTLHEAITTVEGVGTRRATILKLVNPSNVAAAIAISWGGATCNEAVVGATSWTGVDQTTPLGTGVKTAGTTTSGISVTVPSVVGDVVHDCISADANGTTTTLTGGQTVRWDAIAAANTSEGAGQTAAGAASVVMSWTYAPGGSNIWALIGVDIRAAAPGPPPPPPPPPPLAYRLLRQWTGGVPGLLFNALRARLPNLRSVLLDDFFNEGTTFRRTRDGTQALWTPQNVNGQAQTTTLDNVGFTCQTNLTTLGPSPGTGNQSGYYLRFLPDGATDQYSFPNGFAQTYVKAGTFTTAANRMRFKLKCAQALNNPGAGVFGTCSTGLQVGAFVKAHNYSDVTAAGQKFVWSLVNGYYANEWVYVYLDRQFQGKLGVAAGLNIPYDPENNQSYLDAFGITPTTVFDGLTQFYQDGSFGLQPTAPCLYNTTNFYFEVTDESVEPITFIKGSTDTARVLFKLVNSVTVTYNPAANGGAGGYEVTWCTPANLSVSYKVIFSSSSMKQVSSSMNQSTFNGGSWDTNTITNANSNTVGCFWRSPSATRGSAASPFYLAIQPNNSAAAPNPNNYFVEVSYGW